MDSSAALKEIDGVIASSAELWNRHDAAGYASLWLEDASFVNVVGMHRDGRRELLAEVEYLHADRFKNTSIAILRRAARFLSPGVATVNVWWEMRGDPGFPGHPVENGIRRGIFTHAMVRTPQGWRFAASQNTDCLPIPDPLHS